MNFNDIWLQKQLLQKQLGKIPKVNLKLPDINLKGLAAQAAGVDASNINKSPSVRRAIRGSNAIATNQNLRQMSSPATGLVGAVAMPLSDKYLNPLARKAGEELIYLIPQKRDERNRLRALQKQDKMERAWGPSGGGTMGKVVRSEYEIEKDNRDKALHDSTTPLLKQSEQSRIPKGGNVKDEEENPDDYEIPESKDKDKGAFGVKKSNWSKAAGIADIASKLFDRSSPGFTPTLRGLDDEWRFRV